MENFVNSIIINLAAALIIFLVAYYSKKFRFAQNSRTIILLSLQTLLTLNLLYYLNSQPSRDVYVFIIIISIWISSFIFFVAQKGNASSSLGSNVLVPGIKSIQPIQLSPNALKYEMDKLRNLVGPIIESARKRIICKFTTGDTFFTHFLHCLNQRIDQNFSDICFVYTLEQENRKLAYENSMVTSAVRLKNSNFFKIFSASNKIQLGILKETQSFFGLFVFDENCFLLSSNRGLLIHINLNETDPDLCKLIEDYILFVKKFQTLISIEQLESFSDYLKVNPV